ncbi:hypothetical protein SAMN04489835_1125 [Mycolicibacterium rutilum]|uniref:Uncharacterized protein n=1 Tax=Mycolicibacterium rutilum TaxID=370526 RepID=A0A1H6IWR6_MYCRU|nr:hypothetical protein SAMN04489835_1125 [Mycolicibacterium rutilum]
MPAELETLAVELVKAFGPAITETVKVFTEQLPAAALSLVAAGKFAHLAVLAANTVYTGTLTPIAPFAVAVMNALPLPFGTTSGVINEFLKLAINTPFVAGTTVLSLFAQVIDDGLSPVAALTGVIDAVSVAVASALESIEKIAGALGGALPFSALAAPPDQPEARVSVAVDNAGSDSASSSLPPAARTVTLTTNSASPEADSIEAQPDGGEPEASVDGAVSGNGATDLTDGNKVEPAAAAETEGAAADSGDDENAEAGEVTAPAGEVSAPDTESTDAGGEEDPSGE